MPALSPAEVEAADKAAKAKIRVLVADDDRTLRESCAKFLEIEGYSVTRCAFGKEVLAVMERRMFDIAFIDIDIGADRPLKNDEGLGGYGLTLLKKARRKNPAIRVIFMTGHPSVERGLVAFRAGAWEYLAKPFSVSHLQLLAAFAAWETITGRSMRRQRRQRRS